MNASFVGRMWLTLVVAGVIDHSSGAMQMVRENVIDCFTVYKKRLDRHAFPLLSWKCTEEQGHVGKYRD